MGPFLPATITFIAGVVLGTRGKDLARAASKPVGRVTRPVLRATIRESILLSRGVQRVAQRAREDIEDLTAEAALEAVAREAGDADDQSDANGAR